MGRLMYSKVKTNFAKKGKEREIERKIIIKEGATKYYSALGFCKLESVIYFM